MNRSAAALAEATVQQQVGQLAEQVEGLCCGNARSGIKSGWSSKSENSWERFRPGAFSSNTLGSAQTDTQRVSICLPLPDYSYPRSSPFADSRIAMGGSIPRHEYSEK